MTRGTIYGAALALPVAVALVEAVTVLYALALAASLYRWARSPASTATESTP